MDSSPVSIPVLPTVQAGSAWPTFVAAPADRRAEGPVAQAKGASGPIMGSSPIGRPAVASRTLGNTPTVGAGAHSRSSSPPVTSGIPVVAPLTLAQASPTSGPVAQPAIARQWRPSAAPKQPATPAAHVSAPAPVPGTIQRQVPAPGVRAPAPTMPPAPVPAPFAPGRAPARAPVATRVATRVGTVGQASPSEERKASLALTFGVLAIIVPLAIVGAVHYVANAVAVILALVAIVFARQALGISAVSRGAKTRAGWSLAIGIVVILIWIIALTQGI